MTLEALRARTGEMVQVLAVFVGAESPSTDIDANARCLDVITEVGTSLLGIAPEHIVVDGRTHMSWRSGPAKVLLLAHADTVWPKGTIDRWPFAVDDGVATGPGVFDMKAGLVQGLFALSSLGSMDGVELLVTTDEELGSPTSRDLIEERAGGALATLVLEPSEKGALKRARKGVSLYRIEAMGKAAHSGLNPADGANALLALAEAIGELPGLAAGETTVTPTMAEAGTAVNTVPAQGWVKVDVRMWTTEEHDRIDAAMRALRTTVDGVKLTVTGGANRPPFEQSLAQSLFDRAREIARPLGLGELDGAEVGGASDGNYTAGIGVPTLDGLGAVGGGAHMEGEHVEIECMPERAALVAALVDDLRGGRG